HDGVDTGLWTIEFADHALHRLIERAPGCTIGEVLIEAHRVILRAGLHLGQAVDQLLVPAGAGVFLGERITGISESTGKPFFLVRARTWLHADMLSDGQEQALRAKPRDNPSRHAVSPHVTQQSPVDAAARPWRGQ